MILLKDLGYRRVQRTGRDYYIISLPKTWADTVGIEKGSQLAFQIQNDHSLLISPQRLLNKGKSTNTTLREHHITIQSDHDAHSLRRILISLYVTGVDIINLHFPSTSIHQTFYTVIRDLVHNALLSSEIIDETPQSITIQILNNHLEFPIERALHRMAILALSANQEALKSLTTLHDPQLHTVLTLHEDVNRLSLYIIRQLKYGLERDLYKELGFQTPKEFLGYRIVVNDIKNISINTRNVARHITTFYHLIQNDTLFLKNFIDEEVYHQILEFNSTSQRLFNATLSALFKRRYQEADALISDIEMHTQYECNLLTLITNKKLDPNVSALFRIILDSSRRILEASRNIAEITLNRTVNNYLKNSESS